MHDDSTLVLGRIGRILRERLSPAVHSARIPLTVTSWQAPGEPVPFEEALRGEQTPVRPGQPWGPHWRTTWFHLTGQVPVAWAGRHVEASVDLGFADGPGFEAEGLVRTPDGRAVKGVAPLNHWVPIAREATGGEQIDWWVEATANPNIMVLPQPTAEGDRLTASDEPRYIFRHADLVVRDDTVWGLSLDLETILGLVAQLRENDPRRHDLVRAAERAVDALNPGDLAGTAQAAGDALREVMASPAVPSAHRVSAIGNAHIDTAWLWPLRETRRKVVRTMANTAQLCEEYPEHRFALPQAQQLAWLREDDPQVYGRVCELVAQGRIIPVGGQWVEADGNLPGGEALARQLVHGKRFFKDAFGVETKGVWLPDSFGYTAAYPQLARLAGNDWFLTQKISWNQTNTFPHHTLWWEGIDGSRIFTHFPPANTYTGNMSTKEVCESADRFADKGRASISLYPFGHGDGGGGPTREMLEKARRYQDLEGMPRVTIEPPDDFFAKAVAEYPDAPVWSGELYLELHRGSFTTQLRTKQGNRRCEHLLREAELWASTAALHQDSYSYPYEDLERIWQEVLCLQFHDILPGTSIRWVHREAEERYAALMRELDDLIATAMTALRTSTDSAGPGAGEGHTAWNASPFPVRAVVDVEDTPTLVELPASSAKTLDGSATPRSAVTVEHCEGQITLRNEQLCVTIDANGLLRAVRDLARDRELLAAGKVGNLLQLHDDLPNFWDAWDIEKHYRHRVRDLVQAQEVVVEEEHPLRAVVRVTRTTGPSTIVQRFVLTADSPRLDIVTDVEWWESEKLLKASFPLDLHATHESSEIQYGHVQRPTHENTSWDAARFEVPAHRWIHVGESGCGAALLTDTTYGHDINRATEDSGATTTTVRLSLLRAPAFPDPMSDRGDHHFTYSLAVAPHVQDAVAQGYALNLPVRVHPGQASVAPVHLDQRPGDGVVIEAVKLADDRSGDVIVRLYESLGGRGTATLRLDTSVISVSECDLMEDPLPLDRRRLGDLSWQGGVTVHLRPFQVVTLRIHR